MHTLSGRGPGQSVPVVVVLVIILIGTSGCFFHPRQYYLFEPTVNERATLAGRPNQVTDADVSGFANDVKQMLRERFNIARIARLTSSSMQVLTAAAAAALGAASGPVVPVAALAASSAVVPQFQEIFESKERAEAYTQGVHLIEDAEARYLEAVGGRMSTTTLTPAGAKFYTEVAASLKLVETALAQQLPTVKDLQKATGSDPQQVKLVPMSTSLKPADTSQHLAVVGGPLTTVGSSDTKVATAALDPDKFTVTVTTLNPGKAKITAMNSQGGSATVDVIVQAPYEVTVTAGPPVTNGGTFTYTIIVANNSSASPQPAVLSVFVATDMPMTAAGPGWTCQAATKDSGFMKSSCSSVGSLLPGEATVNVAITTTGNIPPVPSLTATLEVPPGTPVYRTVYPPGASDGK